MHPYADQPILDQASLIEALDHHRVSLSLSWRALARALCVSPATLARMREGKGMNAETLARILHYMGAPAALFFKEETEADTHANSLQRVLRAIDNESYLSAMNRTLMKSIIKNIYAQEKDQKEMESAKEKKEMGADNKFLQNTEYDEEGDAGAFDEDEEDESWLTDEEALGIH